MFKPRFGGINFSLNICRAVVVGPLTFILWLWWALTRRSYNYLKSFSSANQNSTYKKLIKSRCNLTEGTRSEDDETPFPTRNVLDERENETFIRSSDDTNVPCTQGDEEMNVRATSSSIIKPFTTLQDIHSQRQEKHSESFVAGHTVNDNEIIATARGSFSSHATSTNAMVEEKSCTGQHEEKRTRILAKQSDNNQSVTSESSKSGMKKTKSHERNVMKHESVVTESTSEPLLTCVDKSTSKDSFDPLNSLYWTSVELPKIYRIKQITRSCLNDVILAGISGKQHHHLLLSCDVSSCLRSSELKTLSSVIVRVVREGNMAFNHELKITLTHSMSIDQLEVSQSNKKVIVFLLSSTGAIREYLVVKAGVENPPDLTLTIPVDIRGLNDSESDLEGVGVSFVLLTSPLPTNTEGK